MNKEFNSHILYKDAAFDLTPSVMYQMILLLSKSKILFTVYDPEKEKFVAFSQHNILYSSGKQVYFEQLNQIISENELLKLHYKQTSLILQSQSATLVPMPLYDENARRTYLEFNQVIDPDDLILTDKLHSAGSFNIFNVQTDLMNALTNINAQVHHHASVLIESLLLLNKHNLSPMQVYINVHLGFLDLVVIKEHKLSFYNSFAYSSAEDFIYFVLFAFEQLKISPDQAIINLSGEIEKNSAVYDIMFKYIRNLVFVQPIPQIDNSYILQNMPAYMYQNLFNAILCEL